MSSDKVIERIVAAEQHRQTNKAFALNRCHRCDSSEIMAGAYEGEGDEVWSVVECDDCGASRTEVFKFTHAYDVDESGTPSRYTLTTE